MDDELRLTDEEWDDMNNTAIEDKLSEIEKRVENTEQLLIKIVSKMLDKD